jgi:hypothetical protein
MFLAVRIGVPEDPFESPANDDLYKYIESYVNKHLHRALYPVEYMYICCSIALIVFRLL